MKAQFKILAGGRAGQTDTVSKAYIAIGRHPLSDLRFDAERDLDVSTRHAAIVARGADYVLQDLQSTNGTFVNGRRISGDTVLADGDVLSFGAKGPAVEFRVLERTPAGTSPAEAAAARASQPRASVPAQFAAVRASSPRSSTAVRIAQEVARQTRQLRRTTKVLFGLLVVVAAVFGYLQWQTSHERGAEIGALRARADSLAQASQELASRFQSQLQGLQDAYQQSLAETAQLRRQLADARDADPAAIDALRRQLDAAEARQRGLAGAAGVDYRAIAKENQDAVAMLIVEYASGQRVSGTGFSVDSAGTLVTNKHVLTGDDGDQTPARIAVKFSGSRQWFPGTFVGVADSGDLGLVRVTIRGGTPRVAGIAGDGPELERGDPVAIIGYPLGTDLPMIGTDLQSFVAEPTLTVGTASKVLSDVVQVDGYGAPGSSGSPIFGQDGKVVAVLYGGEQESNGKIIFGVPASVLAAFLAKAAPGR